MTVFLDAETHRLLYVAEGRSSHAVQEFAQALVAHGGDGQRIQWVAMDMLHCYAKGVREHFPKAQIVYDRFHLMVMAGEAVDEVRRARGFRNFLYLRTIAYWVAGQLKANLPHIYPLETARRQIC